MAINLSFSWKWALKSRPRAEITEQEFSVNIAACRWGIDATAVKDADTIIVLTSFLCYCHGPVIMHPYVITGNHCTILAGMSDCIRSLRNPPKSRPRRTADPRDTVLVVQTSRQVAHASLLCRQPELCLKASIDSPNWLMFLLVEEMLGKLQSTGGYKLGNLYRLILL